MGWLYFTVADNPLFKSNQVRNGGLKILFGIQDVKISNSLKGKSRLQLKHIWCDLSTWSFFPQFGFKLANKFDQMLEDFF